MAKKNCWEIMNCGRQFGGSNAREFGVCPVSTNKFFHKVNDGHNAGRFCWEVKEASKATNSNICSRQCADCFFLRKVREEEERTFCHNLRDIPVCSAV